jgi:multiple antibiotic resistance protein
MPEFIKDLPMTFIPLFVAMDPIGILPIFIAITADMPVSERRRVVSLSTVSALAVCIVFAVIGEAVFKLLGITVDDFKVAGGLLLLVFAIKELTGQSSEIKKPHDVGIVPICVPLLVGPAVLTTLIVLINHYGIVPSLLSLVLNLVIVFMVFSGAQTIIKLIGKNGVIAISKIVALLLAAIAVMMIRIGVESYLSIYL